MICDPNRMPDHITDERVANDPQDSRDDTRPEGCECLYDDGYARCAADRHHDENENCPLFECDCGHAKQDHGPLGCELELGDRYFPSKEITEAGGPCPCEFTPHFIELIARYGSKEKP